MRRIFALLGGALRSVAGCRSAPDLGAGTPVDRVAYMADKPVEPGNASLQFRMVNDPYGWDEKRAAMVIYVADQVAFAGDYTPSGTLRFDVEREEQLVHCRIEVIIEDRLFRLEDKSVFPWRSDFEYLYVALFPDNQSTDQIHFFPQRSAVLQ